MRALEENPAERARHHIILVSAWSNLEATQDLRADGKLAKPFTVNDSEPGGPRRRLGVRPSPATRRKNEGIAARPAHQPMPRA